ncbi:PAS domain S-box protein [Halosegnis marinus]|uniref:PAS domain S-box protein n=1 Tax=Halosegnis marinus TaxID=3034023 RepID=A0ABD5ZQV2_9EURY|nr:PAS domain S-box protein [Halosegnis sp. DT85]
MVRDPPPYSLVLAGSGAVLVGVTIGFAVGDPDPLASSLAQGALSLVVGGGLVVAGVYQRRWATDHRSWRSIGWLCVLVGAAAVDVVWSYTVSLALGAVTLPFEVLGTVAVGAAAGAVVVHFDRRRAARNRERAHNRRSYREVFEGVNDAVLVHAADGTEILDANERAAELYGYPVEELIGMSPGTFSVAEEGYTDERAREYIDRALAEDGVTFEWRNERPDGERYWAEVSLRPAVIGGEERVLAVVRDIDERKRRVRELRVKDRALAAANVGITIARRDDDGGWPTRYANDAFLEMTGYDRDRVLGSFGAFLRGPDTDEETVERLEAAMAAGERAEVDVLNYRADGTPYWDRVSLAPVRDDDGGVTHYVGFHRDVTEHRSRETLFSVMNRVLRHNLSNDLTVIAGHADLLAGSLDGREADVAGTIEETASSLAETGEKARELDTVAARDIDPHPVEVSALAAGAAESLREAFPDRTVEVTGGKASALATSDVERALRELGENGLEHTDGPLRFDVRRDGDTVFIDVVDSGGGLPEMERDVLTSGNETALRHGQGLGLWLANWLVTAAGGRVVTDGADGAAVTVELPAAAADSSGRPAALDVD